ncbi:MAG: RsbRD N-terminal domain-containing protein [Deltaproteobacteria bacterium]|nr:MAG: RsbRD N-terminal domain-containing protein [Deltaproteobacteria bacterium]
MMTIVFQLARALVPDSFMSLEKILQDKKPTILQGWFEAILETYPTDTRRFLKNKKDRFKNPVAHEISQGMEGIFDQVISGGSPDEISPFLERVVKVRAVQDFTPSKALAFIFELKSLVRAALAANLKEPQIHEDLLSLERKIDELGLLSLDLYMKCREKIYELRVNEVKNRVGRLLERANMICGIPEREGDPEVCTTDNLT